MGVTNFDHLNAEVRVKLATVLDASPGDFYGASNNDVFRNDWVGGEIIFHTGDNRMYVQTATSGTTATWVRLLEAFIDYP